MAATRTTVSFFFCCGRDAGAFAFLTSIGLGRSGFGKGCKESSRFIADWRWALSGAGVVSSGVSGMGATAGVGLAGGVSAAAGFGVSTTGAAGCDSSVGGAGGGVGAGASFASTFAFCGLVVMTRGFPPVVPGATYWSREKGSSDFGGRTGAPAELAAGLLLLEMKSLTLSTSASVRLAKAEPFPVIPAFAHRSTSFLLSRFNSFASA